MSLLSIILSASSAASLSFAGLVLWDARRRRRHGSTAQPQATGAEPAPTPPVGPGAPLCKEPAPDQSVLCNHELGHYGWHQGGDRSWWRACWLDAPAAARVQRGPGPATPPSNPNPKPRSRSKPAPVATPGMQLELEFDIGEAPPRLPAEEAQRRAMQFAERWRTKRGPYVVPAQYPSFLAQENWNLRFRRGSPQVR